MSTIFTTASHRFPYTKDRFPGQANDEVILYVLRENPILLWVRRAAAAGVGLALLVAGWWFAGLTSRFLGAGITSMIQMVSLGAGLALALIGWWWVTNLWLKSIALVTTKRLIKFVYTTPVNRHTLSLPLEMIVDTGAYDKGFLQAFFKLGTFTARSSASSSGAATDDPDRINKKYFYIENISMAEDLQHYVNKLLSLFRRRPDDLATFRPFIPKGYGESREAQINDHPEYWS